MFIVSCGETSSAVGWRRTTVFYLPPVEPRESSPSLERRRFFPASFKPRYTDTACSNICVSRRAATSRIAPSANSFSLFFKLTIYRNYEFSIYFTIISVRTRVTATCSPRYIDIVQETRTREKVCSFFCSLSIGGTALIIDNHGNHVVIQIYLTDVFT